MKEKLEIHEYTKVLVPAKGYNVSEDKRLLIPFTSGAHIGFMNHDMEVVVDPKYTMYYGDCYSEEDYVKVAVEYNYGFPRPNNKVAAYSSQRYGLINHLGQIVIEPDNPTLLLSKTNSGIVLTIQRKDHKYGVINVEGEEIVPFGKYDYIDGFDRGFARVMIGKRSNICSDNENNNWGIINERGKEIIPCVYHNIWNFSGKRYNSIIVEDGKRQKSIPFSSLVEKSNVSERFVKKINERNTYNEYCGSYAQNVMDYSDQTIGDAFDGESDAYWNID